eukprot:TRINITY_DN3951_c0_g1_i1.p1 TRINITY_DN3951_c0_g1~~TRINITY_DN3951_c0_g1_i1.p1  ORF type:complete len:1418 (+),score=353.82 TRINITY_DN3951_c0_g1_i1:348-4601(+)
MKEEAQCGGGSGKGAEEDKVSNGGIGSERKGSGASGGLVGKAKVVDAKKEKRRPRLILIGTDSDEDLVSPPQKVGPGADVNRMEGGDLKKDSVANGKKESEEAETPRTRVIEKLWRSRMGYSKSNGGAEIDKKKLNTGSLKCKVEKTGASEPPRICKDGDEVDRKMSKVIVNERKRCKADCSTSKQDTAFIRKRLKTESSMCKEETSDLLDPCSSQKDAEDDRIAGAGNERKRNRAGSFDLQEDDEVVQEKTTIENCKSRGGKTKCAGPRPLDPKLMGSTAQWKESETECGEGTMVAKKKVSNLHMTGGSIVDRSKETGRFFKKKFRLDKGENICLIGASKEKFRAPCEKAIRVQGKHGVLKLLSNNKSKVGALEEKYNLRKAKEKGNGSGSANSSNRKVAVGPSLHEKSRFREKSSSSFKSSKNHLQPRNGSIVGKNKAYGSKKEDDSVTSPVETRNMDVFSTMDGEEKSKRGRSSELEALPVTDQIKTKNKNGRRREKQLLCDQIRNILLNAGWTIDYRQRLSRDYKDAVYIAPTGTEHWSITKAYYAFRKELQCEGTSLENLKEQKLSGTYSDSNHKLSETNSMLPLIPEEALSILKRNRVNKKSKSDKGCKNAEKVRKKKKNVKMKLNSRVAQKGKPRNGLITESSCVGSKKKSIVRNLKSCDGELLFTEEGHSSQISVNGELKLIRAQKPSFMCDAPLLQRRQNKKRRGSALLARSSGKGVNADADDFVPYPGKRTLLSWLIDLGTVSENTKVEYMNEKRKRALLKGWITRDGIHCSCCSKILPASKFEIHAGSKLCQPFENIFVHTGDSLLQCLLDAWDKVEAAEKSWFLSVNINGDDPNDDTCGICGDGGDLICCDGCPSTFHQCCLNMQMLPPGDWHCSNCSCRFCGGVGGSTCHDDGVTSLLSCSQCEGKYHQLCIPEMDAAPVDSNSPGTNFCGQSCRKLFDSVQKLLGVKNNLDAGFSWTLVHLIDKDSETSSLGLAQRAECNSKVAIAAAVMNECFFPIIDHRSGANMVRNVLYNCGSNFSRLNYSSFYTVVLERGDEIVSAASIRIRGTRLAEMPFIGTRDMYRRQGMCRRLLNGIETALSFLEVEMLVIPAISELMHTWTEVFGFKPLEESHRQEMRSMNMMVFPETDMLQKPLLKGDGNTTADADVKVVDVKSSNCDMIDVASTSLKAISAGPDVLVSENSIVPDASKVEKEAAAEPGLHTFGGSNGRATTCDNESWNKSTNSTPDVSFVHDTDAPPQDKPKVENHDLSNEVGDAEPCLHSFGVNSVQSTSEATSFQASAGCTVQNNSEWLVKHHETTSEASSFLASDGTQHDKPPEKVDIAATEPIVYTFCDETVHCTSKLIPQSLDDVSEYKLQASRCKPHESGEGNIVSDKEGIKIGVASVEPNQHGFGDAPAVCTLSC